MVPLPFEILITKRVSGLKSCFSFLERTSLTVCDLPFQREEDPKGDLTPCYLKSGVPVPIYSICVPWELNLGGLRNAESQSPPQVHVLKSPYKQELWVNHMHLKVWKALVSPNPTHHQNHCEELLKIWALDLAHGNSDSLSLGWI